jgi:regulatory protein
MITMKPKANKIYDLEEAREKIRAYCAYRERSHKEVGEKLRSYGLIEDVADQLLSELIQENFLNEERFARAFVRGKFNQKKWGRQKICQALYRHQLSDYVLNKAFAEIDEEVYLSTLKELCTKKEAALKDKNIYVRHRKLADYLIRKGYESDLVWDLIRNPQNQ